MKEFIELQWQSFKGTFRVLKALGKQVIMMTKLILITLLPKKKFKTNLLRRKPRLQVGVMLPLHGTKSQLKNWDSSKEILNTFHACFEST